MDVGDRTIGLAVSDETETFALPLETVRRQEGHKRDMAILVKLIEERKPAHIVLGLPLAMDGSIGKQAETVQEFAAILKRYTRLPIDFQDERYSTREAELLLISADQRRHERKKSIDSMAASVILQTFMDRRKNPLPPI